ncbi:MAG: sugar phosphate isomerase/epimerase family protein [Gemmataceae bacterium]
MLLGYNTNGFAHHRLEDALVILQSLGYQSVAYTVDHAHPPPATMPLPCVVETGARFLLDPWHKHQPTLLSPDPQPRRRFLRQCIELAAQWPPHVVSLWSGAVPEGQARDESQLLARLRDELLPLLDAAQDRGVRLAFEPEPGMFIDTMARYEQLFECLAHPAFGLTLDVGHLHCLGEGPIPAIIERWQHILWNVHIEDMIAGIHDHRMFGEGEIEFPPILDALRQIGYQGGVHVELSRHSHDAVEVARRSLSFLQTMGMNI